MVNTTLLDEIQPVFNLEIHRDHRWLALSRACVSGRSCDQEKAPGEAALSLGESIMMNTDGLSAELTTTRGIVLWESQTYTIIVMNTVQYFREVMNQGAIFKESFCNDRCS